MRQNHNFQIQDSYSRYIYRKWLVLLALFVLLLISGVFSISVGSSGLSMGQILAVIVIQGNVIKNNILSVQEELDDETGVGTFYLHMKQKKDQTRQVKLEGGFAGE